MQAVFFSANDGAGLVFETAPFTSTSSYYLTTRLHLMSVVKMLLKMQLCWKANLKLSEADHPLCLLKLAYFIQAQTLPDATHCKHRKHSTVLYIQDIPSS